ncbi:MAG: 50S ribosomal protein L24 [Fervidicoccaceae archaeon]
MSFTKSSQPRKQRKALYEAPLHRRRKLMVAPLSKELREKYGIKRIPVRVGDIVRIVRGSFIGREGRVARVDLEDLRIYVEGVTRERSDGTPIMVPIHPSKVEIIKLELSDKARRKLVERLGKRAGEVE